MPPLTTASEMAPEHLPDGVRPEELLRDEDLVGYYERALAGASEDDRPALKRRLKAARKAAALTRLEVEEATAEALASLEETAE